MDFSKRWLLPLLVVVLALVAGCSAEAESTATTEDPVAVTPLATPAPAAPTTTPESLVEDSVMDDHEPVSGNEDAVVPDDQPAPLNDDELVGDEEQQALTSVVLPLERAVGGDLNEGDVVGLVMNVGDTLARTSVDVLGPSELHDVTTVYGDDNQELDELVEQGLSVEDALSLESGIKLTFDWGPAYRSRHLDAAVANDFVLVIKGFSPATFSVDLPSERARDGEIAVGDVVNLVQLDGTVLLNEVEIVQLVREVDPSSPATEAEMYRVFLSPYQIVKLHDLTVAILADDIQIIAS